MMGHIYGGALLWAGGGDRYMRELDAFRSVLDKYPDIQLFNPNFAKAPWHLQGRVNGLPINFWPHVLKAQVCFPGAKGRTLQGVTGIEKAIKEALSFVPFEVIEKGENR